MTEPNTPEQEIQTPEVEAPKTETPVVETPESDAVTEPAVEPTANLDVKELIGEIMAAMQAQTTSEPQPEPESRQEPKTEAKAVEPDENPLMPVLSALISKTYDVPSILAPLVPKDPVKAIEFLNSPQFNTLRERIKYTAPINPTQPNPEPAGKPTPDPEKTSPGEGKRKTFADFNTQNLNDLLKPFL